VFNRGRDAQKCKSSLAFDQLRSRCGSLDTRPGVELASIQVDFDRCTAWLGEVDNHHAHAGSEAGQAIAHSEAIAYSLGHNDLGNRHSGSDNARQSNENN